MDELVARIRAVARRTTGPGEPATVRIGRHVVDVADRVVSGGDVRLTPTEWRLLEILVRDPGKLVGQRQLLHDVWGPRYQTETHYLRQYMAQLRTSSKRIPHIRDTCSPNPGWVIG